MPFPESTLNSLIAGIWSGEYNLDNLPLQLYTYNVFELDGSLFAGFGDIPKGDVRFEEKVVNFRANIGNFSGAKTFQNTDDWINAKKLAEQVFDKEGKKKQFAEFKKIALEINEKYNIRWLKTEQNSVFLQSQNARKWLKIENEKSLFPYLKYVTVGDDRVRKSHADLDGLVARVDDPVWNRIHPQNGWGCRCIVTQHEAPRVTTKVEKEAKTREIFNEFKKKPLFDYNPGKSEYIFKEVGKGKHDYFKVPIKYRDDLKNNFGFPFVEKITDRSI